MSHLPVACTKAEPRELPLHGVVVMLFSFESEFLECDWHLTLMGHIQPVSEEIPLDFLFDLIWDLFAIFVFKVEAQDGRG